MSYPYGRPDPSRYVVMVDSGDGAKVFNVYAEAEQARVECARLRALGLDASVREGATGAPDWTQRVRDGARRTRGPVR